MRGTCLNLTGTTVQPHGIAGKSSKESLSSPHLPFKLKGPNSQKQNPFCQQPPSFYTSTGQIVQGQNPLWR